MTDVHIVIEDVLGRAPAKGDRLWVRAARTRSGTGGQIIAPVAVPVEIYDNPTIEMEPGPARVRFELRDLAVDQTREFPVTVPATGSVTLRDILDEAYDWTPDELSAFAQLRADAQAAAQDASDHADRAELAADSFDLTATATTGAPGSDAAVTVSGDGPAYTLGFTVPRGAKGDKGNTGTTEWSGINGKPATFPPTIGTTGTTAKAGDYQPSWEQVTGKPSTFTPVAHKHPVGDLTATGAPSASTFLRGDGSWQTPANTTYSAMSQAEAENSASTTARLATGQRLRQAIDARAVAKQGAAQGLWIGTTATLPTTGTPGVLYVTY